MGTTARSLPEAFGPQAGVPVTSSNKPPTGTQASPMLPQHTQTTEHFWIVLRSHLRYNEVGRDRGGRWGCCCSTRMLNQAPGHLPLLRLGFKRDLDALLLLFT